MSTSTARSYPHPSHVPPARRPACYLGMGVAARSADLAAIHAVPFSASGSMALYLCTEAERSKASVERNTAVSPSSVCPAACATNRSLEYIALSPTHDTVTPLAPSLIRSISRARRCVPLLLGCMALLLAATARARLRSLRIVCSILCSRAVSVESRAQRAAHSQASQAGRSRAPRRRQQQQRASSSSLPRAPSVPFVVTDHGQSIMDPFHWMRGAWQGRRSRSRSRILACR